MIVILPWYYESGLTYVPSGHIGYDSLMCGQSYLECKTQNGQKAECIDYDLPKILGKDDKSHGK